MTVPRERVAVGPHTFPFSGVHSSEELLPDVPMLPLRTRTPGGKWSRAVNAILDTGSTRSLMPPRMAIDLGVSAGAPAEELRGAGGPFKAAPALCDVAVVDAQFPEVTVWELAGISFGIPTDEGALDFPVLGWDVLRHFDFSLSHQRGRIEMRLCEGK